MHDLQCMKRLVTFVGGKLLAFDPVYPDFGALLFLFLLANIETRIIYEILVRFDY